MTIDNFDLESGGVKFDMGKARLDLVPSDSTFAIACVFTYGAIKYDDWNWAKGMRAGRLIAALDRHKTAYLAGEFLDDESGLPHLWHMGCCVHMLISADLRGALIDDRQHHLEAYEYVKVRFAGMNDPRNPVEEKFPMKAGGTAVADRLTDKEMDELVKKDAEPLEINTLKFDTSEAIKARGPIPYSPGERQAKVELPVAKGKFGQ